MIFTIISDIVGDEIEEVPVIRCIRTERRTSMPMKIAFAG